MRREEYDSLCQAVQGGEERFVQQRDFLYAGKVLSCGGERLTVEAFGHRFEWNIKECEASDGANPLGPSSSELDGRGGGGPERSES